MRAPRRPIDRLRVRLALAAGCWAWRGLAGPRWPVGTLLAAGLGWWWPTLYGTKAAKPGRDRPHRGHRGVDGDAARHHRRGGRPGAGDPGHRRGRPRPDPSRGRGPGRPPGAPPANRGRPAGLCRPARRPHRRPGGGLADPGQRAARTAARRPVGRPRRLSPGAGRDAAADRDPAGADPDLLAGHRRVHAGAGWRTRRVEPRLPRPLRQCAWAAGAPRRRVAFGSAFWWLQRMAKPDTPERFLRAATPALATAKAGRR